MRRLDEWIGDTPDTWPPTLPPVVYAYGDGGGDRELWARADHAVRLGRRAALGTGTGAASPFAAIRPRGRARHG